MFKINSVCPRGVTYSVNVISSKTWFCVPITTDWQILSFTSSFITQYVAY